MTHPEDAKNPGLMVARLVGKNCDLTWPDDLATARLVLEGGEFKRAIGEISRGGIKTTGRAVVAYVLFFKAQRTLSRPSWTPVSRTRTVASSRQLHWEYREPCSRGS